MALYLYINLFTISFPLLRSFEKKINYSSKWKCLFPAIAITAIFFLIWDVIFTGMGVWGFNPDYLVGLYFLNLPIEEWLFFVTVPFASVFIYECVLYFVKERPLNGHGRTVMIIVAVSLVILAFANTDKAYTFWNFLFAGSYILMTVLLLGFRDADRFLIAYVVHLIPFLLVNGVLTGSFLEAPIVWYNDQENLGIRIFTIPIEDSMYALLLLFMNVSFYERFKRVLQKNHS